MTVRREPHRPRTGSRAREWWTAIGIATLATALLGWLAIDHQSLWLDELGTWRLTVSESWPDWWSQFSRQTGTNVQMPLYHFFMRCWTQVFPSSEWWLRAANLPWLFIGFLALLRSPVRAASRTFALLMALALFVHPLTWYYADEARPYALLFAGTCLAGAGLLPRIEGGLDSGRRSRADRFAWAGLALMSASSPLGMLWSAGFLVPILAIGRPAPDDAQPDRGTTAVAVVSGIVTVAAAIGYAATTARGLTVTTIHGHGLESLAFGGYEIVGLPGLGPGREDLRRHGIGALTAYRIPLAIGAAAIGAVAATGIAHRLRVTSRSTMVTLAGAAIPAIGLLLLAQIANWRAVGRHMLPMIWFFSWALVAGAQRLVAEPRGARRIAGGSLAVLALAALSVSTVSIATDPRHERENYREAARVALAGWQRGETVWWSAAPFGTEYYGVDRAIAAAPPDERGRFHWLINPEPRALAGMSPPDRVILSRRDTYDQRGAVSGQLMAGNYRRDDEVLGFEIWTRQMR